jgi:hypothetical protein
MEIPQIKIEIVREKWKPKTLFYLSNFEDIFIFVISATSAQTA